MKALKVLALAVLMVMVAVPFASAQTITWNSSFTVVNLGTTDATVTATFYAADGTEYIPNPLMPGTTPLPNPFTVGPGASTMVIMAYVNSTLPNGQYSVVLSADQPIVAIANLVGLEGTNINYNGSYSGSEDVGQTDAYLPSVSNAFYEWYSHLAIQNLTNAAMDVTIEFFAGTPTAIASATYNVPAYSSWALDMDDPLITPALPTSYNGSAVVSAGGPIAVVNNDYNQWAGNPGPNQVYSAFVAGSTDLYCPGLYDMYVGVWISSLNVQNIGTTTATVDIIYSDIAPESVEIGPSAAMLFVYNSGTHPYPNTFSVHVQSTNGEPLVAVANATGGASAQTYECASAGATEIRSPLAMKNFIGMFNTGIQVQNIGTTDADICIEYEGYEATPECAAGVAAGASTVFYTPGNTDLPDQWSGSARVYSLNDLVGIVNETNDAPGANVGDFALSFLMFR